MVGAASGVARAHLGGLGHRACVWACISTVGAIGLVGGPCVGLGHRVGHRLSFCRFEIAAVDGFRFCGWRWLLLLGLHLGGRGSAGPGERINPLTATTTASAPWAWATAFAAATLTLTAAATTTTAGRAGAGGALGGLGPLLGHQLIKLPGLKLLGKGAQGKTEHGHGGPQAEGLLQHPRGLQLVVTETDAEAAGIALPPLALPAIPWPAFPGSAITP